MEREEEENLSHKEEMLDVKKKKNPLIPKGNWVIEAFCEIREKS